MLRVSRGPGARIEADRAGTQVWVGKLAFQSPTVIGASPFVGVDVEDPVACSLADRMISRRREIVMPLIIEHASAIRRCNLAASIAGPGIGDDDLIDEPANGPQTGADVVLLVSDDKSCRD